MPGIKGATIAYLKAELARKEQEVNRLTAERQALAQQLEAVESSLAALRGEPVESSVAVLAPTRSPAGPKPASRRGKRRSRTLPDAILDMLRSAGRPMTGGEIVEALRQDRFPTRSKNLLFVVRDALYRMPAVKRVSRGLYAGS